MDTKQKRLKDFILYSMTSYLGVIIGFISLPITTRLLDPIQFGKYSLVLIFINVSSIFIFFGFDHGYQRYYHEVDTTEKFGLLKKCISFSLYIYSLIIFISFIFNKPLLKILALNNQIEFILVSIFIFFTIINRYLGITLIMEERARTYSIVQIIGQLLNILFIIIFYKKFGGTFLILLYSNVIMLILVSMLYIYLIKKSLSRDFSKTKLTNNTLLAYSIPMALTAGLNWIFQSIDKIAITKYSTLEELGYYAAAFKIVTILIVIQTSFTTFWHSLCYKVYSDDPNEKIFFEKNANYVTFFMILLALGILLCRPIIVILLGVKYKNAMQVMPYLLLIPAMQGISEVTGVGINFSKKTVYNTVISLFIAIVNIIGNIILVPILGALGAGISTGISYVLFFLMRTYWSVQFLKYSFDYTKLFLGIIILVINIIWSSSNNYNSISFIIHLASTICLFVIFRKDCCEIINQVTKLIKKEVKE